LPAVTQIVIKATDLATKPIKGVSGALGNLGRGLGRLRYTMLGLTALVGGFGLANEFIEANRSLETMKARLSSMFDSAKAGDQAFEWIKNFQKANPVRDIEEYTESFTDLVSAGIDPTTGALKSLTAGAVKFGLSASSVGLVVKAIKQMGAISNAQKQELNQLSEQIPRVQKLIQEALGHTSEEFTTKMKQGAIKSSDAINAVFKVLGKDADKTIKEFSKTWDAGLTRLKTSWFLLLTEIGASGIFDDLKVGIDTFTKLLSENMAEIRDVAKATWDFVTDSAKAFFNFDFSDGALMDTFTVLAKFSAGIVTNMSNGFKLLSVVVINIGKVVLNIISEINTAGVRAKMAVKGIFTQGGLEEEITKTEKVIERYKKLIASSGEGLLDSLNNSFTRSQIVKQVDALKELKDMYGELKSSESFEFNLMGDVEKALEGVKASEQALLNFEQTMNEIRTRSQANNLLTSMFGEGSSSPSSSGEIPKGDDLTSALTKTVNANDDATKAIENSWSGAIKKIKEEYTKNFGDMTKIGARFAETLTGSLNSGFDDFFGELIDGHIPNLKEALNSLLQDILKMLVKIQTQKLALGIAETIGSAVSGASLGQGGATDAGVNSSLNTLFGEGNMKPSSGAQFKGSSTPSVEIINNSGIAMEASVARVKNNRGEEIMSVVMDAVGRNKGGSRDSLRALMGS
jgi:tape measure domain-containing protein